MGATKKYIGFLGIVILIVSMGCASSGSSTDSSDSSSSSSTVEVNNSSFTLADHLRRASGITVQGSGDNIRVFVRGVNTVSGNNQPLFVIDGNRAGRSYQRAASMIDVNDIDRIRVIKGSEASSRYGLEGSAGVIVIQTKGN